MLSEEQVESYYREGYVIARQLISPDITEQIASNAQKRFRDSKQWQAIIFDHDEPEKDPDIHRLLWEPNVIETAEQLLGSEPRIYYGMLAIVSPHGGKGLPWHQDNQYTQILGGALNIFVALVDITPDMANLWVAPQSHRQGVQPSKENPDMEGHRETVVEPTNGILLPTLSAGDACIFDRNTYHRTLRNETDRPRFAYASQFQSDHARSADTGKQDARIIRARDLGTRIAVRM